jgi:hypothetical protein
VFSEWDPDNFKLCYPKSLHIKLCHPEPLCIPDHFTERNQNPDFVADFFSNSVSDASAIWVDDRVAFGATNTDHHLAAHTITYISAKPVHHVVSVGVLFNLGTPDPVFNLGTIGKPISNPISVAQ